MCPGTLSELARWRGAIDLEVVSLCHCVIVSVPLRQVLAKRRYYIS